MNQGIIPLELVARGTAGLVCPICGKFVDPEDEILCDCSVKHGAAAIPQFQVQQAWGTA